MSNRWLTRIIKCFNRHFLATVLACLGIGMVMAIIFPIWFWIMIVGISLIIIGCFICK